MDLKKCGNMAGMNTQEDYPTVEHVGKQKQEDSSTSVVY